MVKQLFHGFGLHEELSMDHRALSHIGSHVQSVSFSVEISKYNCQSDFSCFTCEPLYVNAK